MLCFGCSSQHTRKVTGRDNSALGSAVGKRPGRAGQVSAPARCTACPGREERRSSPFVTKTGKGDRDAIAQAHGHRHKHCAPFCPAAAVSHLSQVLSGRGRIGSADPASHLLWESSCWQWPDPPSSQGVSGLKRGHSSLPTSACRGSSSAPRAGMAVSAAGGAWRRKGGGA